MRFVPKIEICSDFKKNCEVFEKHIQLLKNNYGEVIILNLIDKKKIQKKLGEFLESIICASKVNI